MCGIAIFAMAALGHAEEEPQIHRIAIENSKYVFKPIAITPSPNGKDYDGRFLFINKEPPPVMVSGFDKPIHGKFQPRFVRYQFLEDGEWTEYPIGYCGTGTEDFPMKPGQSYEFHDCLSVFREQATPLTGRIGFDVSAGEAGCVEYWSYPFVLDWKKDRESGEFASAKKEHYKKLRTAFSKAGFREELLVGDDFCHRLLQSMMKMTSEQEAATSFKPFVGELDVTPSIELDGKIRIDFNSDEVRTNRPEYRGWFSMDPRKFTSQWLREAAKDHLVVGKWGDDGIEMNLNDGTSWRSPLYLCINYVPYEKSNAPSAKDSEALFARMLNVLAGCLKH